MNQLVAIQHLESQLQWALDDAAKHKGLETNKIDRNKHEKLENHKPGLPAFIQQFILYLTKNYVSELRGKKILRKCKIRYDWFSTSDIGVIFWVILELLLLENPVSGDVVSQEGQGCASVFSTVMIRPEQKKRYDKKQTCPIFSVQSFTVNFVQLPI